MSGWHRADLGARSFFLSFFLSVLHSLDEHARTALYVGDQSSMRLPVQVALA